MADKVKFAVKDLLEPVAFLKPFIPDSAPIEAYTKMAWSGRRMYGQDGIIGASVIGPLSAPKEGVVLEGKRLLGFLQALNPDIEMTAHFTDKSLILSGGTSKAVLKYATAKDAKYPSPIPPPKGKFESGATNLLKALRVAEFCADASIKSGPFSAICLHDAYAWASDGNRATRVLLEDDLSFEGQTLIPMRGLRAFAGSEDPEHWICSGNLFWFVWKDRRIWTRLMDSSFPSLENIFETARELATKAPGFEHDQEELLSAVNVAASAGGFGIVGELENKKLTLKCQGELSEMKVSINLKKARGKATFFVKPDFLRVALGRFVKLGISGKGALYFTNAKDRSEHVLMELVKEAPREYEQPGEEVPF